MVECPWWSLSVRFDTVLSGLHSSTVTSCHHREQTLLEIIFIVVAFPESPPDSTLTTVYLGLRCSVALRRGMRSIPINSPSSLSPLMIIIICPLFFMIHTLPLIWTLNICSLWYLWRVEHTFFTLVASRCDNLKTHSGEADMISDKWTLTKTGLALNMEPHTLLSLSVLYILWIAFSSNPSQSYGQKKKQRYTVQRCNYNASVVPHSFILLNAFSVCTRFRRRTRFTLRDLKLQSR